MANTNKMKAQHSILMPNRIDFKTKTIIRVKKYQYNSMLHTSNQIF